MGSAIHCGLEFSCYATNEPLDSDVEQTAWPNDSFTKPLLSLMQRGLMLPTARFSTATLTLLGVFLVVGMPNQRYVVLDKLNIVMALASATDA